VIGVLLASLLFEAVRHGMALCFGVVGVSSAFVRPCCAQRLQPSAGLDAGIVRGSVKDSMAAEFTAI